MHKFLFIVVSFIYLLGNSSAQKTILYGGNSSNIGGVDTNGLHNQIIHERPYEFNTGYMPSHAATKFLSHPNGKLYSIIIDRTGSDRAHIYSYDTISDCIMILYEFEGEFPIPNTYLILGPDSSTIYGTCYTGGNDFGNGFIFSFDPLTNNVKKEISFGENLDTFFTPNGITKMEANKFLVSFFYGGKDGKGGYLMFDTLGNELGKMQYGDEGSTGGPMTGPLTLKSNGWLYGIRTTSVSGQDFMTRVNPLTGYSENLKLTSGTYGSLYCGAHLSEDILGDKDLIGWSPVNRVCGFSTNNNDYTVTHSTFNPSTGPINYNVEYRDRILIRNNRGYKPGISGSGTNYYDFATGTNVAMPYPTSTYYPYHTSLDEVNNEIYYCTRNGGTNSVGHLSHFNSTIGQMEIIYNFSDATGSQPEVLRKYGNILVGIANSGGNNNAGLIFTYDPATSDYQIILHLDSTIHGKNPAKEINFISSNTFIYVNRTAGPLNGGTLVKVNLANGTAQVLKSFYPNNNNLKNPYGNMVTVNGAIYGIAQNGAALDKGGIFKYDPSNKVLSNVASNSSYSFGNGISFINDTLYTIITSSIGTNHAELVAFDISSNNLQPVYNFYNPVPAQALQASSPLIAFGNSLYGLGVYDGNKYIYSINTGSFDTTLRYKFPVSYNTNHTFKAELNVLSNTKIGTTVYVNTTSHAGLFVAFDTLSNTLTNTIQLSNLGITTSLYFNLQNTPVVYGNKIVGIAGLGGTSSTNFFLSNAYIYSVNLDSNISTVLKRHQFNSYSNEDLSLNLFRYNDNIYDIVSKDSIGYLHFLLEILPNGNKNWYPLNTDGFSNESGTSGYVINSVQANDSLVYFNTYFSTTEFLCKVNLNTKQSSILAQYPTSSFTTTELFFTDGHLIMFGTDANYEGYFDFNFTTGQYETVLLDSQIEGFSATTTEGPFVYFMKGRVLTRLDINNNFMETPLKDFQAGYGSSHYIYSVAWLQKMGNFIHGIGYYGSGGISNGPFKYDILNDSIYSDNYYMSNATDFTEVRIFDGNKFYGMSDTWLYMHDVNTKYTKSIYGIGGNKFILIDDSTKVEIFSEMQSTCLGSKQVLRATTNNPNSNFYWYKNDVLLSGENNDTLIIENLTPADTGYYHCRMNTLYGKVSTNEIHLTFDYCDPVFPGDANSDGVVDPWDIVQIGLAMNNSGLARPTISNSFTAFDSNDWETFAPNNINHKHTDSNGDAIIDFSDTVAVHLNYGLSHGLNLLPPIETNLRIPPVEIKLSLSDSIFVPISVGELNIETGNNSQNVNNIYGLYYEIYYNPDLIEPSSIFINHNDCWIESPNNSESLKIKENNQSQNKIVGSIMRYDHSDTTGFGSVLKVNYTTTNYVLDTVDWVFRVEKLKLIQHDALFIPIIGDSIAELMGENSACQSYYVEVDDLICQGSIYQLPDGSFTSTPGIYYDTIPGIANCDSVIKTTLIEEVINASLFIANDTIFVDDETYTNYQWYNCDLNALVSATNTFYLPTVNGNYALIVSSSNCTDTTNCINYNLLSVDELTDKIRIYPNPVVDDFRIESEIYPIKYSIIDAKGSIILVGELFQKSTLISLDGISEGVYYLRIMNDEINLIRQLIYINN